MNKSERFVALGTTCAGIAIMVYAWRILTLGDFTVPDAGLLPFLAGTGLTVLSAIWALTTLGKAPAAVAPPGSRRWKRPLLALLLMVLYAWAIDALGYISSTLVFTAAWQQIIERERWLKTVLIAAIGTAAMYVLFVYLLKLPIPQELFLR